VLVDVTLAYAGKMQGWKEMIVDNFSYIAVDLNIDVTDLCHCIRRLL
jgi:hypothetical protein